MNENNFGNADLLRVNDELNHIKDLDALLDKILTETRRITNSDGGSIFLIENNRLSFSYVQNETLQKREADNNKQLYSFFSLPIDERSIAGYVAKKGETLIIDNINNIKPDKPYTFNSSFDEMSNYQTISMMTIPLKTSRNITIGVMQLINVKDEEGNIISFSKTDESYINYFANFASVAIEKAQMTREIILRMIKMAELRDPKETGAHVNRVGAYSIEIYDSYAMKHSIPDQERKAFKDILRIAAMLHDVGKVAISDMILKKPAKLDENEFRIMQTHTSQGANLFNNTVSDLDNLSKVIALTHHEKWSGEGYPAGLKGEEIPLAGRIVALADVYDALISQRVYKPAWTEERVLKLLSEESGKHFDPELIEVFMKIYDIIRAIRAKFPDK